MLFPSCGLCARRPGLFVPGSGLFCFQSWWILYLATAITISYILMESEPWVGDKGSVICRQQVLNQFISRYQPHFCAFPLFHSLYPLLIAKHNIWSPKWIEQNQLPSKRWKKSILRRNKRNRSKSPMNWLNGSWKMASEHGWRRTHNLNVRTQLDCAIWRNYYLVCNGAIISLTKTGSLQVRRLAVRYMPVLLMLGLIRLYLTKDSFNSFPSLNSADKNSFKWGSSKNEAKHPGNNTIARTRPGSGSKWRD